MDEKHKRGSMKEDQDRERRRQETPGRSPQSPGSSSSGRDSHPTPGSNKPGGGSSGMPDSGSQKGSRDYFHEEQESEQ